MWRGAPRALLHVVGIGHDTVDRRTASLSGRRAGLAPPGAATYLVPRIKDLCPVSIVCPIGLGGAVRQSSGGTPRPRQCATSPLAAASDPLGLPALAALQLLQECSGFTEVRCMRALAEPSVAIAQHVATFLGPFLLKEQTSQARRCPQF